MKAFIENGVIFVLPDELVPKGNTIVIDVDDATLPSDLIYRDGKLRYKTAEEMEADRIMSVKVEILQKLQETDEKMPRSLEDLYDIMLKNKVINDTDIPTPITNIIKQKKELRAKLWSTYGK